MRNIFTKKVGFVAYVSFLSFFLFLLVQSHYSFNLRANLSAMGEHEENEEEESKRKLEYIEKAFQQEFDKTKDPYTNTIPSERLLIASEAIKRSLANKRSIGGINWLERGPSVVGGRTRALIFDRRDVTSNTVFAGSVAGGLWKGTNISSETPIWTKLNDILDNVAISCIIQDPANMNTLYAGTGETYGNIDAMRGLGIWKSTDGGLSWKHLVSTNNADFYYTQKIIINGGGNVFAATSSGLKKSTNGGTSWTTVLPGDFADMELAANNDIYASTFLGRVYKSTAANAGAAGTWANVSPNFPSARIEISTAPSDAQKVYLLCQGASTNDCEAIFRSDNGGQTWQQCTVPTIFDQAAVPSPKFTRGQAWYDLISTVDPNAPNTIIVGGVDACKSDDGGLTWNQITIWSSYLAVGYNATVHADHHALVYAPGSSSRFIWGTDGGVYFTDNVNVIAPAKPTVGARNTGYNVTQFYAAAVHPAAGSNYFLAGAQDNGTRKFGEATAGMQQTEEASGGDGAFCHIDQADPRRQITSYVYNNYYLSTDSGVTFNDGAASTRGSFINPTDYDTATKTVYGDGSASNVGGQYARWNTTGSTVDIVSYSNSFNGVITHVAVSPNVANRLYFGLNNGRIVYVNGANTGADNVGTLIKTGVGSVSGIAIEPGNENHMVVTYSNYGVQSVFESFNATAASPTWTNIEGNLPDMPVRWVVFHPTNADKALIATELGVWSTDNLDGANTEWNPTNGGLANTRVDMLKVRKSDNMIVAATHGRGLFTTTLTNTVLPTTHFKEAKTNFSENSFNVATNCALGYRDIPVTLMISNPVATDLTVSLSVDPASNATQGQDYTLSSTTLNFPAGTTEQSFNVRVFDDNNIEGLESVVLNYSITSGGSAANKGTTFQTYQLDILDNEAAPFAPFTGQYVTGPHTTNLGGSSPLQSTQTDKKIQYLYRASELLAAGLKAGPITSFSFTVGTKASTLPYLGFTIKLGIVHPDTLALTRFADANFTTVYTAPMAGYTPAQGENTFPVTFNWDGTSNLVFEFCYNNLIAGQAGSDDILQGETTAFNSQARQASTTGIDEGCSFNTPSIFTFRPVFTFAQPVAGTVVAALLNTSKQANIGPFETVHYYDGSGRIIATIQNLDNWNYGCTTIDIDRAGTGAQAFYNNDASDYVASKTLYINPTNNNPNGRIRITLYYTEQERTGWEAATGQPWDQINLVKVKGGHINDVNPTNTMEKDVEIGYSVDRTNLGTANLITANFNSGFSGFGIGRVVQVLPVTLLTFNGKIVNNRSILQWSTTAAINNKGFDIEKSANGVDFSYIGFVKAAASVASSTANYSFTDPAPVNKVQYYRLKQLDNDDRYSYSHVVLLNGKVNAITITPNPFTSYIDIKFAEPVTGKTEAVVTDMSGKTVLRAVAETTTGLTWRLSTGNINLAKGTYILKLTNNNTTSTFKILKG